MKLLAVVCLVMTICGRSTSSPRHYDALRQDASHEEPTKLLALLDSSEHSQELEYIHRHPRRLSLRQPTSQKQRQALKSEKNNENTLEPAGQREITANVDHRVQGIDHTGKFSIKKHPESHEKSRPANDDISLAINYTEHPSSSVHKRKNIFQLIKHLELALDIRKRKDKLASKENRSVAVQKFLKKPTQNPVPINSDADSKKHNHGKNNNSNYFDGTELKSLLKMNKENSQHIHTVGHIQKIGKIQKSEEDWINVAAKEINTNIGEKPDVKVNQFIKSVENEVDLTEHAIAKIIKQLRDILSEDISESSSEDPDENILLVHSYLSSEPDIISTTVKPTTETSRKNNAHTDDSSVISLELAKNSTTMKHLQDYPSVLPLNVDSVNSSESSSVESESAISSSESSDVMRDASSSDPKSTDDSNSSSFLSQSQESYSDQHRSKYYVSASSQQSQSQGSSSVQADSSADVTTLVLKSRSYDSTTDVYDNSTENGDVNLYTKYEKILAEKVKNDSIATKEKVTKFYSNSVENENVIPLKTTEAPIRTTTTETTTTEKIIIPHKSLEAPTYELVNVNNDSKSSTSNEVTNVTKLYEVLPSAAVIDITRDVPSRNIIEIPKLGTIQRDVSDVLENILMSENDLDLSTPDQKAIDSFFEEIAQELGETVQLVAETVAAEDFARKESIIRNTDASPRHDRAVKTYNLAFHFNK